MRDGRIGMRTGAGFLDYSGLDIDAYREQRLAAMVDMLRHFEPGTAAGAGSGLESAAGPRTQNIENNPMHSQVYKYHDITGRQTSGKPRSSQDRSACNSPFRISPSREIVIRGTNMSTAWKVRAA